MTGFVPALATPLDKNGNLCVESYKKQIDDQIKAGAAGILAMGSMGIQAFLKADVFPKVAEAAVEAAAGRVPVFVGAMDNSIARAKDRMAAMEHLDIDGFVFTTPYYHPCTPAQIINYYKGVAAATKKKILMYDLAVVTQSKITYDIVLQLIKEVPNLAGIKSAAKYVHALWEKLRTVLRCNRNICGYTAFCAVLGEQTPLGSSAEYQKLTHFCSPSESPFFRLLP